MVGLFVLLAVFVTCIMFEVFVLLTVFLSHVSWLVCFTSSFLSHVSWLACLFYWLFFVTCIMIGLLITGGF